MPQDTQLDFSVASAAVTSMTINNVTDPAGSVTSAAIDFGGGDAQAPAQAGFHATLLGLAGSVDYVEWYILWSEDNTAFQHANVAPIVHATEMQGTTTFEDIWVVDVKARYGKLHLINNSGANMGASGNAVEWYPIAVDQA